MISGWAPTTCCKAIFPRWNKGSSDFCLRSLTRPRESYTTCSPHTSASRGFILLSVSARPHCKAAMTRLRTVGSLGTQTRRLTLDVALHHGTTQYRGFMALSFFSPETPCDAAGVEGSAARSMTQLCKRAKEGSPYESRTRRKPAVFLMILNYFRPQVWP